MIRVFLFSLFLVVFGAIISYFFTRTTGYDKIIADKTMAFNETSTMDKITAPNPFISEVFAEPGVIDVSKLKLIKTANILIEVKNYENASDAIDSIIKLNNAYISSARETRYEDKIQNCLTLRTPASNFDNILQKLLSQAHRIESKTVVAKDVTEEYVDISARLNTKKELEKRYLDVLKQARTVKDILEVESNLSKIREDIESTQGRLNLLDNQIILSTIELTYFQYLPLPVTKSAEFAFRIGSSLVEGWNMFLTVMVAIMYLWVFIVLGLILIGIVVVTQRRRRRRSQKV